MISKDLIIVVGGMNLEI